jgi:ADP-heptose:LPS heptosyltransferase
LRSGGLVAVAVDTLRAIARLRREGIDTAIDFEFFSRFSGALAYLSGARIRVGFHSYAGEAGYRGDLMTHRVAFNIRLHASQTYRMLVDTATVPPDQLPMLDFVPPDTFGSAVFRPDRKDLDTVKSTLRSAFDGRMPSMLVLLNANAGDLLPIRRWSDERYVQLARRLLESDPKMHIALTGAPSERAGAKALAKQVGSKRCVSVAGKTTLGELFALYCLAEVMVTNDSGPAHYASTTTMDCVTLFGPESPQFFGAQSPRSHLMWAGLACSPCVNAFNQRVTRCRDNRCMQAISVDAVFEQVMHVLAERTARGVISVEPAA